MANPEKAAPVKSDAVEKSKEGVDLEAANKSLQETNEKLEADLKAAIAAKEKAEEKEKQSAKEVKDLKAELKNKEKLTQNVDAKEEVVEKGGSTMLYRKVGEEKEHDSTIGKPCNIECEYKVFEGEDVAKKQKEGWVESPFDLKD